MVNNKYNEQKDVPQSLEQRVKRMESRLVQLMIHLGVDPHEKAYDRFDSYHTGRQEPDRR